MIHYSEQEIIRRKKLEELKKLGINPYPPETFEVNTNTKDIKINFLKGKKIKLAGRLMSIRIMGKSSFAELQDHKGKIQIYITRKDISKNENFIEYDIIFKKLLDIGDFIGIQGFLFKTKVGEISIHVKSLKVLSKSLRPLPIIKIDQKGNIYDDFSNKELRYRMRYVDLIVNSKTKKIFLKRSKMFQSMREYFNSLEYIEVETPILQKIPGGATARPFTTYHNTLNIPLYLRISNELYLKRLIVGGFKGVYEFSKNFRNEGMDRMHNPEFTAMEIYIAYKDYNWMMDFTEKLLQHIAIKVNGKITSQFMEHEINWMPPYKKISIKEAIYKFTNFDITTNNDQNFYNIAISMGIETEKNINKNKIIEEIFKKKCEKKFIQPTFITDYPIDMSPLAKKHRNKKNFTERFELLICGQEIANSYSELNDPIDQKKRFEKQITLSDKYNNEEFFIDKDFIKALEYGMPPTAGLGIGMDRLIMFLTNSNSIQEVLLFPQTKN